MPNYRAWREIDDGSIYTLTRRLPVRFDISASSEFPLLRKSRLAHQVRQDLWRALQGQRGFSPVVQIETCDDHMILTAGGPCVHKNQRLNQMVKSVLTDPQKRARWIKCAALPTRRA